jgi:N-acetylmuramoyl-L-alanine amidase
MNRRDVLKFGGLALTLELAPAFAAAPLAQLAGVRVWPGREVTRVTVETSSAIKFQTLALRDPLRLVIDLEGADVHEATREVMALMPANNPTVADVRIARNRPGVTRIVLDLKREVQPDAFQLQPIKPYAHRLVLDLRPRESEDLIGQFLAQLEAKQREASALITPPKTNQPSTAKSPRVRVIAIDAGHGGEDPGAIGPNGLKEKDVTLAIALRLRDLINARPNLKAFLTRDDDYFVPLHERVEKARAAKADLMISIHADAFTNPEANGASVFALSDRGATSAAARYLAQKENGADRVGGVRQETVDAEVLNLKRDISNNTKERSEALARLAVNAMTRVNRMHKKQVEFAGFAVLRSPDVPSILVETAFISNPDEEEKLGTDDYQSKVARALMTVATQYVANAVG